MRSSEAALRALRSLVQFELVVATAKVAEAARLSARTNAHVASLQQRAELFQRELRQVLARPPLNAALLDTVRRQRRAEQIELHAWLTRQAAAWQRERHARDALAELRNRERSLERALRAEHRKEQRRIQVAQMIRADELWLQHSLQETA